MEKRPGRGADQFILRLPEGMRDAIREQAEQSGRSMNAEIIARLEFASQHTPEEIDKLKREIATLEKDVLALEIDFHDQVEEIEGLKRDKTELKQLMNHFRDLQERLMYHVLNYIDEIPAELSIWAFDMAQIVGSPRQDLDVSNFSESEARETIRARRDAFRKRALESVKDFLASRDDEGAEKA